MDQYERVRSLPFDSLAAALSMDISQFKTRPFSCVAKGRGAVDLTMAVRQCRFKEAVTLLESYRHEAASPATSSRLPQSESRETSALRPSENPPFKASYDKFAVPSAWLTARGLTEDTLKTFEVFEYNNPARRSVYGGSVMLTLRRWCDGECVGYRVLQAVGEGNDQFCALEAPDKSVVK